MSFAFCYILSFTSIASTSLLLLRPLTFTGINNAYTYPSPDLMYFHGRHLVYSLVVTTLGLLIIIGLPVVLLLEPFLNHKVNFIRIKPFLDQFQGCYKDKYRCFASSYMICLMLAIASTNITNIFIVASVDNGLIHNSPAVNLKCVSPKSYCNNRCKIQGGCDGRLL